MQEEIFLDETAPTANDLNIPEIREIQSACEFGSDTFW